MVPSHAKSKTNTLADGLMLLDYDACIIAHASILETCVCFSSPSPCQTTLPATSRFPEKIDSPPNKLFVMYLPYLVHLCGSDAGGVRGVPAVQRRSTRSRRRLRRHLDHVSGYNI